MTPSRDKGIVNTITVAETLAPVPTTPNSAPVVTDPHGLRP
jgi:hypothetical protein